MSEQSPTISNENILLGVEAARLANEIYDEFRRRNLPYKVTDVLEFDEHNMLQTSGLVPDLGRTALHQTILFTIEHPDVIEFARMVTHYTELIAYADLQIGRDTPGSDSITLPVQATPGPEIPYGPEAH